MDLLVLLAIIGLVYVWLQKRNSGGKSTSKSPRRRERIAEPPRRTREISPERRQPERVGIERGRVKADYTIHVSIGDGARSQAPDVPADDCWVPPGTAVTVAGRTIDRGMVYVGRGLKTPDGWGSEISLVDPALRVAASGSSADPLPYYPAYAGLTPTQRAAYLDWLAGGAADPEIPTGYVFLYFYGLERRALMDDVSAAESELVRLEVERLHSLYGDNRSFDGYARSLLSAVGAEAAKTYEATPVLSRHWEPTLALKVALGQAVVDGAPIPSDWALLWLYQDTERTLRTSATRCPDEMRDLFRRAYTNAFGEGLQIKRNKTPLRPTYRAASGRFETDIQVGDLPDVAALKRPLNKLRPLGQECSDALDAYSRFVGRNPGKAGTKEALGFLPRELAAERLSELGDPFVAWAKSVAEADVPALVTGGELIRRWGTPAEDLTKAGAMRKNAAVAMAGFLDVLGLGIEPDARRGGRSPGEGRSAVLFVSGGAEPDAPSPSYQAAEVALTLVAAVAHADDDVTESERTQSFAHVRDSFELAPGEAARLDARLTELLHAPPSFRGLKTAIGEKLNAEGRRAAADLALLTAVADGRLDPVEGKMLSKVYRLLGLDPETVYSDLHMLQSEDAAPSVVQPARRGAGGFALPPLPGDAGEAPTMGDARFTLDMALVQSKLADTQKASVLLAGVFTDDDDDDAVEEPTEDAETADGVPLDGLDGPHASLLAALVERSEWARSDYEAAAAERDLMAGGALETINEWAFDHLGDALIEDGDPVVVYLDLWTESSADA